MNPFQLLAVGQSLIKGNNQPSPYKMDEQHLLPKFAKVGRPISLAPPPKPVAVPKDLFRSLAVETAEPGESDPQAEALESAAAPMAMPACTVAAVAPAPVPIAAPKDRQRKAKRRLFAFGSKPAAGQLVQAELSLDAVKVICNDLNDSDFEIVSPRQAPVASPAPVASTEEVETAVSLWKRWSNRVVGAVRTII